MSELIERLLKLVVDKLNVNSSFDSARLVSELESEIEAAPQFAGLLRTNHLMIQINQGDAQAFQTLVQGGTNYFGGIHNHLEFKELDTKKLEEILKQLIPKLTNTRSIVLAHQPPNTSGFQGRLEEINQLQQWLITKGIRLVGIVSPGGYGTSTLAARIYYESSFEQNIWVGFNQSYSFKTFSLGLLEQIGQKVDKDCSDESFLTNALINYFSNHSFLLVLDNLESLLNQEDRQFKDLSYQSFFKKWLEVENKSVILLTSRERPAILEQPEVGIQWLPLGGLTDIAGSQWLHYQEIGGNEADLCHFSKIAGGHPLLLKLAAGWLKKRYPSRDVSYLLTKEDLNLFEQLVRQRGGNAKANVGEILNESVKQLEPGLKSLWLNLSVYKYPFGLKAAKAMLAESVQAINQEFIEQNSLDLEESLQELVQRSLIEQQPHPSQDEWQYHFLKLVKDFAQTKENDWKGAKEKAIEYCRCVAKPSGWTEDEVFYVAHYHLIYVSPNWKNQGDIAEYLEIFYHYYELGQYAPAFDFLWSTGCDAFLELRGYNSIRLELYQTLKQDWAANLSQLESNPARTLFAEMLNCFGTAYRSLGQYPLAIDSHWEALNQFSQIKNREREQAVSYNNLGDVYSKQGEYPLAEKRFKKACEIFHGIKDVLGELLSLQKLIDTNSALGEHQKNIELYKSKLALYQLRDNRFANTLNALGITYKKIGKYREAVCVHRKALKIFKELADRQEQAESWSRLGDTYEALGRHEEAIDAHQQALQLNNDNRLKKAPTLCQLGWVLQSSGKSEEAIEMYEQALKIFREIGNRLGEANALNGLGAANSNFGNYQQAENYYQNSLNIHREFNNRDGEAAVLNNLGLVYEKQRDILLGLEQYRQAIDSYQQSLEISKELPDRDLAYDARTRHNFGRVCNLLGQFYYNQRQYQQADQFYKQALSAFEGIQGTFRTNRTQEGELTAFFGSGNACHFLGQYSDAIELHNKILDISRKLGNPSGEAEALLGLGNVYYSLGNYNKPDDKNALKFYQKALSIFQELKAEQGEARVKLGLGKTYHSLGQYPLAIKYLGEGGS